MADYNIPLGVDVTEVITGFDKIEQGLSDLTKKATEAGAQMNDALMGSIADSDQLAKKLSVGAEAATKFKTAANDLGVTLNKSLSGDSINPTAVSGKVGVLVAKMKDVIGKPIDFKFNFDKQAMDALTAKLKDAKSQTEGFQIVLAAANERLKTLVKGSEPFRELNKQIKEATDFMNVLNEEVVQFAETEDVKVIDDTTVKRTQTLKAELRQIKAELAAMELAGETNSARFAEMATRAGELEDQIGDTNARIRALASDTAKLDAGITAMRGLAAAFAVGQGALAAFGDENEAVAESIRKVQGAMAILQGVQEIANVLNKDSALIVYLQSLAHRQNTAAVVAETEAVVAETVATEAATVATSTWTAALLANPITAIVAGLAVLAGAIYYFSQQEKNATMTVEELNKALEDQQGILDANIENINNGLGLLQANLDAAGAAGSSFTKATRANLELQKAFYEQSRKQLEEQYVKLNSSEKDYAEKEAAIRGKRVALNKLINKLEYDIQEARIKEAAQLRDEENKLQKELLAQRIANVEAEKKILKEGQAYAAEIINIRNAELKDGNQREIAELEASTKEKLQKLQEDGEQRKAELARQRKELALDIESDPLVLAERRKGLEAQERAEIQAAEQRKELILAIEQDKAIKQREINEKYQREQILFNLDIQAQLLSLQKETVDREIELNAIEAERKITQIKAQGLSEINERKAIDAVLQQLDAKNFQSSFDFAQREIELERVTNLNKLESEKAFTSNSLAAVNMRNVLKARIELEAAEKELAALEKFGRDKTSLEYQNALARVNAARRAADEAVKNAPAKTFFQLIFPEATGEELQFIEQQAQQIFSSLGQAVDSYAAKTIARYNEILEVKRAAVAEDEKAISELERQLDKEIKLREDGYASDIEGVRALLAEKVAAREKDIQAQEEAQKQIEEIQKRQAIAQAVLQAANLITAATNIYLKATELGGPVGVVVGGAAIAAMIAAFAAQKSELFSSTQSFGEGGEVDGKSHTEGGVKYFSTSPNSGVVELEGGEYVVNKKATQRYMPLIEVINNSKGGDISESVIKQLLEGTGAHMQVDEIKSNSLVEARENQSYHIANTTIVSNVDNEALQSINAGVQVIAKNSEQPKEQVYQEGEFTVIQKGNKKTKIRNKK